MTVSRFLSRPASPQPLGVLRIAVGSVATAQVLLLWPYLLQLYGNFGFVQWAVIEAGSGSEWLPSVGKVALVMQRYGIPAAACVYGVFGLYATALVSLTVGWRTRTSALAACLLHTVTVGTGYLSMYGVDTMLHVCLFYCVWMPVGESLSLDSVRRGGPAGPSFAAGLSLRVLQLHLCLIYADTGLAKLQGHGWWTGESVWRAVMQEQFAVFPYAWLADVPLLAQAAGLAVLVVEAAYPALIWPERTRRLWLLAIVGLHAGIAVTMGLWLFSAMMVTMNLAAFGASLRVPAREVASDPRPNLGPSMA